MPVSNSLKLETFDDVVTSISKSKGRAFHLLLGNGFSMAYAPKIFSYNALHDFVSKSTDKDLIDVLSVLTTRDFEVIMRYLDNFATLADVFGATKELKERIKSAGNRLKSSLLDAVKAMHPEHVFKVPETEAATCATFLKVFLDSNGSVFSTNYDLLLYWVLMRSRLLDHCDGCGRDVGKDGEYVSEDDLVWSELRWGKHRDRQNVFYLHGALPFFDAGHCVWKEEYDQLNFLLTKISDRMNKGEYPIFVTAGDGQKKLSQIKHNEYLNFCYDRLCCLNGSLVTFGFNFGASDYHIIDAINRAAHFGKRAAEKLWSIYIGVYSPHDHEHIQEISGQFKCKVHVFDSKTARVWR